jgi:hypothetical protein
MRYPESQEGPVLSASQLASSAEGDAEGSRARTAPGTEAMTKTRTHIGLHEARRITP